MKKWVCILVAVVAAVAFLFWQGSSPARVEVRLAGYETNGIARLLVKNSSEAKIFVGNPRVEIKGPEGWTNHFGMEPWFLDLLPAAKGGEEQTRLHDLPAGEFTWRATVKCEVMKPTLWKSTVNKALAKLNLPKVADSRIISVTTPEYHRVLSASSATASVP